jgi:hypothetical protein
MISLLSILPTSIENQIPNINNNNEENPFLNINSIIEINYNKIKQLENNIFY